VILAKVGLTGAFTVKRKVVSDTLMYSRTIMSGHFANLGGNAWISTPRPLIRDEEFLIYRVS
jgi:hypothetical protein